MSRAQLALVVAGGLGIAYGAILMLPLLLDGTAPLLGVGTWWLGGPLVVDLVAVPLVVVAGIALGRFAPPGLRRAVAMASAMTLLLGLVALPFLTGLGRRPDNASLLDRNYLVGYLALVALSWAVPLAAVLIARVARRLRSAG